jgi:Carboxypeptidase regulatory-like domain
VLTDLPLTISHRACFLPLALLICLTWYDTLSFADDQISFSHITGIVSDVLGRPVVGAVVTLQAGTGRPVASVITNADGKYRIFGMGGGTYLLTARMRGFKPASIDIITPLKAGRQWNLCRPVAVIFRSTGQPRKNCSASHLELNSSPSRNS